jgi:hypothetical protein
MKRFSSVARMPLLFCDIAVPPYFCISMLGYIQHCPIRWRIERAATIPGT